MTDHLNESPLTTTTSLQSILTPEEEAESDRMLDALREDYRNRLVIPQYVSDEADRLEC